MRLATPLEPIMDNMYLETHWFFVPYRTVWQNFEKFHGAQDDPGDSISFTIPKMSGAGAIAIGSTGDYMGMPVALVANDTVVSALPNRALRKIWNEWYRDENLQDSIVWIDTDGPDSTSTYGFYQAADLLKRGKRLTTSHRAYRHHKGQPYHYRSVRAQ